VPPRIVLRKMVDGGSWLGRGIWKATSRIVGLVWKAYPETPHSTEMLSLENNYFPGALLCTGDVRSTYLSFPSRAMF
jgi:hypothetical protein